MLVQIRNRRTGETRIIHKEDFDDYRRSWTIEQAVSSLAAKTDMPDAASQDSDDAADAGGCEPFADTEPKKGKKKKNTDKE